MRPLYRDLLERMAWTFIETSIAIFLALPEIVAVLSHGTIDVTLLQNAVVSSIVGGGAAALAVLKGFAASRRGDLESAATLRRGHLEEAADAAHILHAQRDPYERVFTSGRSDGTG